jgi:hypothetical protein
MPLADVQERRFVIIDLGNSRRSHEHSQNLCMDRRSLCNWVFHWKKQAWFNVHNNYCKYTHLEEESINRIVLLFAFPLGTRQKHEATENCHDNLGKLALEAGAINEWTALAITMDAPNALVRGGQCPNLQPVRVENEDLRSDRIMDTYWVSGNRASIWSCKRNWVNCLIVFNSL